MREELGLRVGSHVGEVQVTPRLHRTRAQLTLACHTCQG
jgi:hypothetical protein